MTSRISLTGKTVLITGASGGLGCAISNRFVEEGCNLILHGRDKSKLEPLCQTLEANKSDMQEIYSCTANLEDTKQTEDVARELIGSHDIDILINNAGIFPVESLQNTTVELFEKCMTVNITAPFILSRILTEKMKQRRWGRIINIGSSSSYGGFPNTSTYCASKHALLGFSRSIHNEYKNDGIRTYCVSPGSIQTPMGEKVIGQDYDTFIDPDDIAEYCIFLCSFDGNVISEEVRLNRVHIQ